MRKLTILTEEPTRMRQIKTFIKKITNQPRGKWGGHTILTSTLVNELKKRDDVEINYRPWSLKECYENVHVLASVEALQWAIEMKRKGYIKHLTAGPNVVEFVQQFDSLVAKPEIEKFIVHKGWGVDYYERYSKAIRGRLASWIFGLDPIQFSPSRCEKTKVVLYLKNESIVFGYQVKQLLEKNGYDVILIRYGSYKREDYIRALDQSKFMVTIGGCESQGIFLGEAWGMNVPTICYDRLFSVYDLKPYISRWGTKALESSPYYSEWKNNNFMIYIDGASSCPLLSAQTGVRFSYLTELKDCLARIENGEYDFQPRKWFLENMTLEKSVQDFLDIVFYWEKDKVTKTSHTKKVC